MTTSPASPACGETVYVSEDDLDAGEANCAHCGVTFEVALEGEEDEAKDAPVQYEVTCPACGKTAVFEEDELLDGAPKCPNCGEPLDFEVTEE
jgi:transcription elongation factor Elf1